MAKDKIIRGDIILIPFPFTDLSQSKVRPCLLLTSDKQDITIVFITSIKPKGDLSIEILPSSTNGIKVKSYIRYTKIATLDSQLNIGKIGTIEKETFTKLKTLLSNYLFN
jgi:mRNA interferase MazF